MAKKVGMISLGCPKNQGDAEMMLKKFDQLDTQQKHLSAQQSELAKRQNEIDKASEKGYDMGV